MNKLLLSSLLLMVFSVASFTFSIHEDCMKHCEKKEEACRDHCDRLTAREQKVRCHQHCEEKGERCHLTCHRQGHFGGHKGTEGHHEEEPILMGHEEHAGY